MSNHTSGPWAWYGVELLSPDTFVLATTPNDKPEPANARLIAAAPDLLAALRDVIGWVPGPSCFATSEPRLAVERAQAAIAKATEAQP